MSFYPAFPEPKPGPQSGSQRPAGAPNNGSMGGRPPVPTGVDSSPIERLAASILPIPPTRTMPNVASPTANAGGEMWPDATMPTQGAKPQQAGGEMWPDARGSGAPAPSTTTPSGVTINIGGAGAAPTTTPATPAGSPSGAAPAATSSQPTSTTANPDGSVPGAGAQPSARPAPPAPVTFTRTPREDEIALVPEGAEVITPFGTGVKKNGTVERYNLTPAGQEAHKRATLAARERFGRTPFDGDPAAPQLPIVVGGLNYNPWAPPGREWSRG